MNTVVWKWQSDQGTYHEYDPYLSKNLEEAYQNHQSKLEIDNGDFVWVIDFQKMVQIHKSSAIERPILREIIKENKGRKKTKEERNKNKKQQKENSQQENFKNIRANFVTAVNRSDIGKDATCCLCLQEFEDEDFDEKDETKTNVVRLSKCNGHFYHYECCGKSIEEYVMEKGFCPYCKVRYVQQFGNQPEGQLSVTKIHSSLPGYPSSGTILMSFSFPSGIQGDQHPHPGKRYHGDERIAYFPDTKEGRIVVSLFQIAFQRKLLFTIGHSLTRGIDNGILFFFSFTFLICFFFFLFFFCFLFFFSSCTYLFRPLFILYSFSFCLSFFLFVCFYSFFFLRLIIHLFDLCSCIISLIFFLFFVCLCVVYVSYSYNI